MKNRKLKAAIKTVVIFTVIYLLLSFTVVMLIYEGLFARTEIYEYSLFVTENELKEKYAFTDVEFESRGFALKGSIYGENREKLVILGHAKGGSSTDMLPEAECFLKNGFSVLTMDFTGHSKSGGSSQYGLQQPVYDMENAINYVKQQGYADIYLYGIGIGGYAAASCADFDGVRGVAAISAFSSVSDVTVDYATSNMGFLGYLEYPVMMLYQYLVYGSDINNSAVDAINRTSVPVVVINGTTDEKVHITGSALINSEGKITNPNVSFITVDGGYHLSLMRTEAAVDTINSFNEKAYELYNEYGGEVPVYEIETLYASVDKNVTSSLNDDYMNKILEAFSE